MSMLNNVVGYWAYIRGAAYIRNEVSVSTCGGLIHRGDLYLEVYGSMENFPGT